MQVFTIYNGIIEKKMVIRRTRTGYRVLHDAYSTGRQISGSKVFHEGILRTPYYGVTYVTESIDEAVLCAKAYADSLMEEHSHIQKCIDNFQLSRG